MLTLWKSEMDNRVQNQNEDSDLIAVSSKSFCQVDLLDDYHLKLLNMK